jgi:hypothetical protein
MAVWHARLACRTGRHRAATAVQLLLSRGLPPVLSYQFSLAVPTPAIGPDNSVRWPSSSRPCAATSGAPARLGRPVSRLLHGSYGTHRRNGDPFATAANERRRAHCRFVAREHGIAPETVAVIEALTTSILPSQRALLSLQHTTSNSLVGGVRHQGGTQVTVKFLR